MAVDEPTIASTQPAAAGPSRPAPGWGLGHGRLAAFWVICAVVALGSVVGAFALVLALGW